MSERIKYFTDSSGIQQLVYERLDPSTGTWGTIPLTTSTFTITTAVGTIRVVADPLMSVDQMRVSYETAWFGATEPTAMMHDAQRFPHRCPKCGGHAYVGLAAVEHEGAMDCR